MPFLDLQSAIREDFVEVSSLARPGPSGILGEAWNERFRIVDPAKDAADKALTRKLHPEWGKHWYRTWGRARYERTRDEYLAKSKTYYWTVRRPKEMAERKARGVIPRKPRASPRKSTEEQRSWARALIALGVKYREVVDLVGMSRAAVREAAGAMKGTKSYDPKALRYRGWHSERRKQIVG